MPPLSLEQRLEKALALLQALPPAPAPRVLALDGRAAAGKTTLANALAQALHG